jgi:hypothetical protein
VGRPPEFRDAKVMPRMIASPHLHSATKLIVGSEERRVRHSLPTNLATNLRFEDQDIALTSIRAAEGMPFDRLPTERRKSINANHTTAITRPQMEMRLGEMTQFPGH